jgi:hypothetical protein
MKNELIEELLELCDTNKDDVAELGKRIYEAGYDEGYDDGEKDAEETIQELEEQIECLEGDAVTDPKQLEFAIEQFKEMNIRGISPEQMLAELESELCRHMPVTGPTLFSK